MSTLWVMVARRDEVPDGEAVEAEANGLEIALYGVGGEVYATAGLCTHAEARLCEGFLEGHEIECPLHQGRFDVRTGEALCPPVTEDIRTLPVRIENGLVYVAVE